MLYVNSKEITEIKHTSTNMIAVYHLSALVWQNAVSCFGRGYWDADAPWSDDEGWQQQ